MHNCFGVFFGSDHWENLLDLLTNHWTTLRSVCLCVIWHQWRGPCLSRTYGCHISLDQVMLSTGLLGYSRHPSCSSSCWEIPGHLRHENTIPLVVSLLCCVQKKPLKEWSLYLNPKNSKTPPSLWPTITWWACFRCLQYHFSPQLPHYCSRYTESPASQPSRTLFSTCRQRDAWSASVMARAWQQVYNE